MALGSHIDGTCMISAAQKVTAPLFIPRPFGPQLILKKNELHVQLMGSAWVSQWTTVFPEEG
jgi:hypothetical protein